MQDIMDLCGLVRETGFAIHRYHKQGLLINCGAPKFQIKKHVLSRMAQEGRPGGMPEVIISLFCVLCAFSRLFQSGVQR
jgi:hypothetical protein